MQRILSIIKKEYLIDRRQKHMIFALFLYVLINSYIAYRAFNVLPKVTWSALFLIIFLFVALNAILKSFGTSFGERYLHYYSYYQPTELFIAKLIYNFILLLVLSIVLAFVLLLLSSNTISNLPLFFVSLLLGSIGVSTIFSFVSLISIKANTNSTAFAVLAMPLVLPILLSMLKINAVSLGLIIDTGVQTDILILVAIILMFLAISIILFPILWKS